LGNAETNGSISLGAGADTLTFGNFTNSATVGDTATIMGGSGSDTITLASALTDSMKVDLGGGSNKLTLAAGGDIGTVSNVNTLIGGTGTDTITLGTVVNNGSVSLGSGEDTLTLANGTNRLSVANVGTVQGGSGADTIVLTGSTATMVIGGGGLNFITGNTGADQFVFDQDSAGNNTTVMNFSTADGDKIALDTTGSSTLSGNTYNLGGAALTVGVDLADVANAAARTSTTLSNGGNGAFVYEQDTGGLYYSANGSFSGGGTQIGTVTTNGTTAWTFNANAFTQV